MRLPHGETCKTGLPRTRPAASLQLSAVFLRLTALIIPFLITLRFSKGNGITSNNSSDLPRSRNSATIKYQIEISQKYWESIFRSEGITDCRKQQERIVQEKQSILDFLTGAENSGKAWFSTFYITPDGKEQHDVVIDKIDDSKEGGDWSTDIQEA